MFDSAMFLFGVALGLAGLSYWNYHRSIRAYDQAQEYYGRALANEKETEIRLERARESYAEAVKAREQSTQRLNEIEAWTKYEHFN